MLRCFHATPLAWAVCPVLQCAEHVMLVDLGRNDVGKVSRVQRSSTAGLWACHSTAQHEPAPFAQRRVYHAHTHTRRSVTTLAAVG